MPDGRETQRSMSANHGNNSKIRTDKEELWRYRLSMDQQLTVPHPRIQLFIDRYLDWYKAMALKQENRDA